MKQSSFFGFDVILFSSSLFLMVTGILFVYSSGVTSTGEVYSFDYIRQIIWAATGLIILLAFALFNHSLLRLLSIYIYAFCLILLIITLIIGREVNGAKSWLGIGELGIQPSEFMKIATILLMANYLASLGNRIKSLTYFLPGLIIIGIPIVLILLQPDMGTALVYIPIFLIMTFLSGARLRHIFFILITGFIILVLSIIPIYERFIIGSEFPSFDILSSQNLIMLLLGSLLLVICLSLWGYYTFKKKYFYWFLYVSAILFSALIGTIIVKRILKGYQAMRLIIFLNPYIQPKGAGWNIIQSITAIGSGGFLGKGFLMGTQSHYNYLPQQSTDFIFSILAEEWGFLGASVVIILFFIILIRGLRILTYARDNFAIFTGTGIIAMFFFHIIVNIGMTMGIMPVTGIPLFFLSHGGSSLWTGSIGLGILHNIYMRRYRY